MSNKDMARVVIQMETEVGRLRKDWAKVEKIVQGSANNMQRSSARAAQKMQRDMTNATKNMGSAFKGVESAGKKFFSPLAVAATAALAPILSVAGALGTAKAAMREFSQTGDVAQRLGIDVERLQELRYAAEQGGMSVTNFDVALRRFIRRSSEAAQGTGAAVGAFKELGISVRDADGNLKASDKLLGEVADRMTKVKDPADKLRLAFKMFDTDGAAMVNVLANGSKGLDEFSAKARSLGIVVERHMIARAQELSAEFDTATRIIDLQFKQALVNLAPVMVGVAERAARLAGDIRSVIDSMRDLENQGSQSLDGRMRSLGLERMDVERQIADIREMQRNMVPDASGGYTWERELGEWNNRLRQIADEETRILKILESRKPAALAPIPEGEAIDTSGGRTGGRNAAAEAALREAEAVKALIADLQFEREQIGLTDLEKRTNETLRRAGAAATAEEREQIKALVAEIERETESLKANEAAQQARTQAIVGMFQMGGDALMSIVDGSMKAEEAVKRLAVQLALAAAQAALLGSGPLAGLFGGGLFGGGGFVPNTTAGAFFTSGFSSGGYTGPGPKNKPAGIVHAGEVVWSQDDVRKAGGVAAVEAMRKGLAAPAQISAPVMPKLSAVGGGGGNVTVSVPIHINAPGADSAALARVEQQVTKLQRDLPATVISTVRQMPQKNIR
ncbi:MAG: hypothetical protein M9945_05025 [Aquamicrobium sp.]|uniref:hypothetical protein n=1 Tax=Aquamicrobium sp. TaxID=1872579 RepID=UPI00349EB259|nr:hypothetical protein [Aquamicrobium sp.]